jgi:uncharacterized protein (TIGR03086 family)
MSRWPTGRSTRSFDEMSENLRLYQAALYGMNAVVVRVDPARWDEPSKCAEWTCREVIGHAIWHTRSIAAALGQGDAPPEQPEAEAAGDDPVARWVEARDRVLLGLDQPDAIQREIEGAFGPMTVDARLQLAASDIYTHSWDIGSAVGVDPALDPSIAAAILPRLLAYGDGLRRPGLMGPEIDADDNDSVVDRFLAYCGRDPRS